MKILSLNVRGLGGSAKHKSLQNLFASLAPDLIFLQETMTCSHPTILSFSKLCPGWEYCDLSSSSLSGGLIVAWNPRCFRVKAFKTVAGILLKAHVRGSSMVISLLNCYGPYNNREKFWDSVVKGGLLNQPNLVLAGDLNLTLNCSEVWGKKAHSNPIGPFFSHLFSSHQLVDIAPASAGPT